MSLPKWELSGRDPRSHSGGPPPSGPRLPQQPPSQPVRVAVPRPRAPGDAVGNREGQPVCEASGEGSWLQSRAAGGDEPDLVDLLRLHTPALDVVIVRVSGTVDRRGPQLLAELARKQLDRTPYLVIAPGDVAELTRTRRIRPGNQRDRQPSAEVDL
jgi:hypothetical protein